MEASEEEKEKILKLAKEGKLVAYNTEAFERLDFKNPDSTLTKVELTNTFTVLWETKSAGFGGLTFWVENGKLMCDAYGTGKDFCKKILCKLVDDAEIE